MSREATCFSCRQVLHVSADAQGRWLTCPRCLASVGNPNVLLPTEPPPTGAPPPAPASVEVQTQLPETTTGATTCPSCGREVDPVWRACPYCESSLREARPKLSYGSLDAEVGRDSRGTNFVAIALGALLILGVVLFVVIGGPMMVQSGTNVGQVILVGLLALGAFVAGVIALAVGARHQAVTAVSGVLGGLVVGVGVVLLVVLVACMTIAAAITNFMHTCGCK
jgi:hypothetical protein